MSTCCQIDRRKRDGGGRYWNTETQLLPVTLLSQIHSESDFKKLKLYLNTIRVTKVNNDWQLLLKMRIVWSHLVELNWTASLYLSKCSDHQPTAAELFCRSPNRKRICQPGSITHCIILLPCMLWCGQLLWCSETLNDCLRYGYRSSDTFSLDFTFWCWPAPT